jgi:gluconokinase
MAGRVKEHPDPSLIVVMGVAGSGKSTVGGILADQIGWAFLDADAYHSRANRAKMSAGVELTDADRAGWLRTLNRVLLRCTSRGIGVVLACSALKERYRAALVQSIAGAHFVYLQATPELCRSRLSMRTHFFHPSLLNSQFTTLEEPRDALVIDASAPAVDIATQIRHRLFGPPREGA